MSDKLEVTLRNTVAEAWHRWPEKSAAGAASRRSYVRAQFSGDLSFALMYDAAYGTDTISESIDRILAVAEPRTIN
jgi:hypothetical protein